MMIFLCVLIQILIITVNILVFIWAQRWSICYSLTLGRIKYTDATLASEPAMDEERDSISDQVTSTSELQDKDTHAASTSAPAMDEERDSVYDQVTSTSELQDNDEPEDMEQLEANNRKLLANVPPEHVAQPCLNSDNNVKVVKFNKTPTSKRTSVTKKKKRSRESREREYDNFLISIRENMEIARRQRMRDLEILSQRNNKPLADYLHLFNSYFTPPNCCKGG